MTDHLKELSKTAGAAVSHLVSSAGEIKKMVKEQVSHQCEHLIYKMDLVTREEFNVVKAMAEEARKENKALRALIEKKKK